MSDDDLTNKNLRLFQDLLNLCSDDPDQQDQWLSFLLRIQRTLVQNHQEFVEVVVNSGEELTLETVTMFSRKHELRGVKEVSSLPNVEQANAKLAEDGSGSEKDEYCSNPGGMVVDHPDLGSSDVNTSLTCPRFDEQVAAYLQQEKEHRSCSSSSSSGSTCSPSASSNASSSASTSSSSSSSYSSLSGSFSSGSSSLEKLVGEKSVQSESSSDPEPLVSEDISTCSTKWEVKGGDIYRQVYSDSEEDLELQVPAKISSSFNPLPESKKDNPCSSSTTTATAAEVTVESRALILPFLAKTVISKTRRGGRGATKKITKPLNMDDFVKKSTKANNNNIPQ